MTKFLRETQLIFARSLRRTIRNPAWVIIGLFQPVLYLLLFAPLLDSIRMPGFEDTNSLNVFVPGLLVMIAIFSAGFAGFGIIDDLREGVIERLRVTPANRLALLLGMVLHDVLVFLAQCLLLVVTALAMGFRADLLGLVLLFGLMALLGLMMASFSYALTLILRDQGALAAMLSTISQPLLLLSGILLPLTLAPKLLQSLAELNPFSHTVDASRALIAGQFGEHAILLAFAIVIALTVMTVLWATQLFRKATA